jgi:hypothetical protein
VQLIGKEANNIDEAQAGRYAQLNEIITEYLDSTDDHFHQHVIRSSIICQGENLHGSSAVDRRIIDRVRAGQMPRPALRTSLTALTVRIASEQPTDG